LLDEQFHYVSGSSGFEQVGADTVLTTWIKTGLPMSKNGYLYVYTGNESPVNVYFDNLQVSHVRGALLEETHYYAFGLTMAGISSKAAGKLENKYKFNGGNELQSGEWADGSGLEMYDAVHRMYDPQLGRFFQIDKLSELSIDVTPYGFARNNPILLNDPLGLKEDTLSGKPLPEVTVTSSRKAVAGEQLNQMNYGQLTGWIDAQRKKGYTIETIQNWALSNSRINNNTIDKILDATNPNSLSIRLSEGQWWETEGIIYRTLLSLAIVGARNELLAIAKYVLNAKSNQGRISADNLKEFKQLIQRLSQSDSRLSQKELDQLRSLSSEYGGGVRVDLSGIKGSGVNPHAHIEGLGKSVESRHIWLQNGVK
jgi:RHS repeat-associated protein